MFRITASNVLLQYCYSQLKGTTWSCIINSNNLFEIDTELSLFINYISICPVIPSGIFVIGGFNFRTIRAVRLSHASFIPNQIILTVFKAPCWNKNFFQTIWGFNITNNCVKTFLPPDCYSRLKVSHWLCFCSGNRSNLL